MKIGIIPGLLLAVGLMTGCSPKTTAQFEVVVKNQSKESLSVGIVKMHGEMSPEFATPAQIFLDAPEHAGRAWGTLVKPGEVATLGPSQCSFEPGSYAALRAYVGNKTISELVAVGTYDPDMCNVILPEGKSAYVLVLKNGKLMASEGDGNGP